MPSEDLKAENTRLRARVAALEAELAAKPAIDRVSLFRMANNAPWGVMAVSADGRLDFANTAMQRWLNAPAPAIGAVAAEAFAPTLREALEGPLAAAFHGRETRGVEIALRDVAGELRELRLFAGPRSSGPLGVTGAVISLYDITDTQALDRSVRENEARLTHINAVTPTANYIFDFVDGRVAWAAGMTEGVYGYSARELMQASSGFVGGLIHPDDFPKVGARLAALARQSDGTVSEIEVRVRHPDGTWRWILDRATVFERAPSGRISKTINAAIDIDERKRAEERRTLLINELNHRVKNTLAAVQSIARQTLRGARPPEQTMELFTARLVALSAAHNVLTRENWEGAGLKGIVDGALEPFAALGGDRIRARGPEVRLTARAALGMAMALHELATNAAKYGSLSGDIGAVDLTWRFAGPPSAPHLQIEWRESGGPPVSPPLRGGFGTRLLTQGLRAELDGAAELEFAADGLVCRIAAPLEPGAEQPHVRMRKAAAAAT